VPGAKDGKAKPPAETKLPDPPLTLRPESGLPGTGQE
jgi:hypothetical protein